MFDAYCREAITETAFRFGAVSPRRLEYLSIELVRSENSWRVASRAGRAVSQSRTCRLNRTKQPGELTRYAKASFAVLLRSNRREIPSREHRDYNATVFLVARVSAADTTAGIRKRACSLASPVYGP